MFDDTKTMPTPTMLKWIKAKRQDSHAFAHDESKLRCALIPDTWVQDNALDEAVAEFRLTGFVPLNAVTHCEARAELESDFAASDFVHEDIELYFGEEGYTELLQVERKLEVVSRSQVKPNEWAVRVHVRVQMERDRD